jgi:hypothetical protein
MWLDLDPYYPKSLSSLTVLRRMFSCGETKGTLTRSACLINFVSLFLCLVRASDRQCTSCNGPGFDPNIRRHSGILGAADEAVLNIVRKFFLKISQKIFKKKRCFPCVGSESHPEATRLEGVEFRLGQGGAVTWRNVPSAHRSFPLFVCNAFQVLPCFSLSDK